MHKINDNIGFSLIELMIVIAIIGILAAIGIPSYKTYTERARFTELVTITEVYKTAIALALQQGLDKSELSFGQHGIPAAPAATQNLAQLTLEKGILSATATARINNQTYILKPNDDGSFWTISGTCLKSGLCHA